MVTLGRRIAMARAARKMSLEAVGTALGYRKSTIWYWENGKTEPSISDLLRISQLLSVNHFWLTFGEGDMWSVQDGLTIE